MGGRAGDNSRGCALGAELLGAGALAPAAIREEIEGMTLEKDEPDPSLMGGVDTEVREAPALNRGTEVRLAAGGRLERKETDPSDE